MKTKNKYTEDQNEFESKKKKIKTEHNKTNNIDQVLTKENSLGSGEDNITRNTNLTTSSDLDIGESSLSGSFEEKVQVEQNLSSSVKVDKESDKTKLVEHNTTEVEKSKDDIYLKEAKKVVDESVDLLVNRLAENNSELLSDILQSILSIRKEELYSHNVFNEILDNAPGLGKFSNITQAIGTLTRLVIGREKVNIGQERIFLNEKNLIDEVNSYLSDKFENLFMNKNVSEVGDTSAWASTDLDYSQ